jgi:hypothetical protein
MTPRTASNGRNARLVEVAFLVGYLALAGAVLAALTAPATGYELSIYAATPPAFWIGAGVALAASLGLSVMLAPGSARGLALLLGGETVVAILALPVIRGYSFYGAYDALTHLGWVKDLASGALSPFELFYPGLHTSAVFVGRAAGVPPEQALLLAVLAVVVALLAFVPLLVRAVSDHPDAVVVGAFAGFLLLPVNLVSTHVHAHPFSQTTLLSAMLLFLLVRYVRQPTDRPFFGHPTAFGAMLALAGAGIVIYHAQQAVNVLVVMATVSLVQFVARRRRPASALARHRPLYGQTAFVGAVFVAWAFRFQLPFTAIGSLQTAVQEYISGQPPEAASSVQSQAGSLTAIGGGLEVMFVKLFLVSAIFWALAAWLVLGVGLGRHDGASADSNGVVTCFAAGAAAIVPLFLVYLFGSISEQYFRHWGFLTLIATVLGAVAIVRLVDGVGGPGRSRVAVAAVVVAFAVMLPLSLVSVFPSPYVYQSTPHVTDEQLSGYETVFDQRDETVPLLGVRQGPWRESDAVHGVTDSRGFRSSVPDRGLSDLASLADGPRYLVVSDRDREREVGAYEGLRYTRDGFDSLDGQQSSSRVFSNGDVELYWITG